MLTSIIVYLFVECIQCTLSFVLKRFGGEKT